MRWGQIYSIGIVCFVVNATFRLLIFCCSKYIFRNVYIKQFGILRQKMDVILGISLAVVLSISKVLGSFCDFMIALANKQGAVLFKIKGVVQLGEIVENFVWTQFEWLQAFSLNNGSQLKNPHWVRLHIEFELKLRYSYTEFSICRGRQRCQGSSIDPHY